MEFVSHQKRELNRYQNLKKKGTCFRTHLKLDVNSLIDGNRTSKSDLIFQTNTD